MSRHKKRRRRAGARSELQDVNAVKVGAAPAGHLALAHTEVLGEVMYVHVLPRRQHRAAGVELRDCIGLGGFQAPFLLS